MMLWCTTVRRSTLLLSTLLSTSALMAFAASSARAAQVTEVQDAADDDDPFDDFLTPKFRFIKSWSRINRERCVDAQQYACGSRLDGMGRPVLAAPYYFRDVKELDYTRTQMQLLIENRAGIYKDFELHLALPITLQDRHTLKLAAGVQGINPADNSYSSLVEDGFLFGSPNRNSFNAGNALASNHTGVGDLTLGLAWAPFNDERDPTKAAWKLAFDVSIPTGKTQITALSGGGVGRKTVELGFSTALSKRLGQIDPYVGFGYTLPVALNSAYANRRCDPTDPTFTEEEGYYLAQPDQTVAAQRGTFGARACNDDSHLEYGMSGQPSVAHVITLSSLDPGQRANMFVGMEIIPWEQRARGQKVAIDLRVTGEYHQAGRDYTAVSDFLNVNMDEAQSTEASTNAGVAASRRARSLFVPNDGYGELTRHEEYAVLGALVGFYAQMASVFRLFASADFSHTTEHVLTGEAVGFDRNGNGKVDPYLCPVTASGGAPGGCGAPPASVGPNAAPLTLQPGDYYVNTDVSSRGEQNPDYNALVDQPGRRLKLQRTFNLGVTVGFALTF